MKKFLLTPLLFSLTHAQSVWVEAESATQKSIQTNGWYSDVKKAELSDEGFLAHWGNQTGSVSYQVEIPEAGDYTLWLRANPVGSKLEVKVGAADWTQVDFKNDSHETINIATDNKPDLRFVSWVKAGKRALKAGEQEISIRFNSENNHHGMLDCFCLTTDQNWIPRRIQKPGEAAPHWQVPEITDANLDRWIEFVRPSAEELGWRQIRWHRSLSEAAEEARRLERPILLWAMNGHPCGET